MVAAAFQVVLNLPKKTCVPNGSFFRSQNVYATTRHGVLKATRSATDYSINNYPSVAMLTTMTRKSKNNNNNNINRMSMLTEEPVQQGSTVAPGNSNKSEIVQTDSIMTIARLVRQQALRKNKRVLVLCDIDNTVLFTDGPGLLGSDQWFR